MLVNAFKSFKPSYQLIFKDKVSFVLMLAPILMGVLLYMFAGKAFFTYALEFGNHYIKSYVENETFGGILSFLVGSILSIMLFFIVNWTFVLVLSILASPFNDFLSARIEKLFLNENLPSFKETMGETLSNLVSIIFNEVKKVFLIILFTVIASILGIFPLLIPVSILITVLLLAAGFLDYSWGRHNIHFKACFKDITKNILSYGLGGAFFMMLVSIPVLNVFVPSLATSFFTILWVQNNENRH